MARLHKDEPCGRGVIHPHYVVSQIFECAAKNQLNEALQKDAVTELLCQTKAEAVLSSLKPDSEP